MLERQKEVGMGEGDVRHFTFCDRFAAVDSVEEWIGALQGPEAIRGRCCWGQGVFGRDGFHDVSQVPVA